MCTLDWDMIVFTVSCHKCSHSLTISKVSGTVQDRSQTNYWKTGKIQSSVTVSPITAVPCTNSSPNLSRRRDGYKSRELCLIQHLDLWEYRMHKYLRLEKFPTMLEKLSPKRQSPFFLPFHYLGVDMANRVPLSVSLPNVVKLIRQLRCTWPQNKTIPWCGSYMKDHEKEEWPLLFIYSRNDRLLSWRYVEEVIRQQKARGGRQVHSLGFDKSGPHGHVAHLKYHREEYIDTVGKFLDKV